MIDSIEKERLKESINPLCTKMGFEPICLEETLKLTDKRQYCHAAHCLLYCKISDHGDSGYFGLGQVRYDGFLGFPGGVVGEDEPISTVDGLLIGLRRELLEEINYISPDGNHGFTHVSSYIKRKVELNNEVQHADCNIHHFFLKQITEQQFSQCELNHTKSTDFPLESLGIFRIPLIDPASIGHQSLFRFYADKGTFLVNFFKHNFAGTAKGQLFDSLVHLDCISHDYLTKLRKYLE
ncbi:U8 snoRNA-decapping enzyme-like [Tetranychus urticae]|uniref:U8 snoRNA-decapping enzyme-like n=1 Tax=Tetranychus urticae TaxID=32264 RepID=UPI00077B9269|nr:U8 snoRNA-decapping enzyme-like [Tetranychus urticae]